MPIVTSEIIEQRDREVRYRFVDHLANDYFESWQLNVGVDATVFMGERAAVLEADLAIREVDGQVSVAEQGNNPDKVPDHQTQTDFDRRLIGRLMTIHDVDTLIAALDFWTAQELRNGNNNNQRAVTLGVPLAEYVEADGRFGDLQGVAGGVQTVNAQQWDDVKDAWL